MKNIVKIVLLIVLFLVVFTVTGNQPRYKSINASELDTFMSDNPDANYIDVRTEEEFAQNSIDGFVNIDSTVAAKEIEENYEKDDQLVIICRSGNRSQQVSTELAENGFTNVYNVSNGIVNY